MAKGKRIKWVFSGHKMRRQEIKRSIIASMRDETFLQQLVELLNHPGYERFFKTTFGTEFTDGTDLLNALERDEIFSQIFDVI